MAKKEIASYSAGNMSNEQAIPEKIQTGGYWWHGISRSIEERACRNSRGQVKQVQFFQANIMKKKSCGISMNKV